MALLLGAIFVMVSKARYLAGVDSANQMFLKRYRRMDGDLVPLSKLDLTPAERATFPKSPLARIYESGIDQVETRNTRYGNRPLSGETVEAIRSELDAQQTTENQKFDRLMVLLTIAISGGPFIGLLGTVIGVMTTFGGVALAGDVNVNAIAPGIAAALLATIAGLSAAIPSLFGYNYLNSRISTISDEMRVFVDRLVTRLAETQAHRADPPTRLAAE
jgi:biopolymer transport protein ExbB